MRKLIVGLCVGAVLALGATPAPADPPPGLAEEICEHVPGFKKGTGPPKKVTVGPPFCPS
jgi:hypothetical protein